jgi:ferredoxin
MVDGCTPHPLNPAGERIVLECRRVASADRDPAAVVVPCLGGLTPPDLLDLVAETEGAIVFADHGWCADCSVGRCGAPWQPTLDESRELLGAIGQGLATRIKVERKDLPVGRAKPIATALRPDRQLGRRDLLKLLTGAAEPRDARAESRRVVFGRGLVAPLRRERILDRIGALAADHEETFPASLMPTIEVADGCELNGLCAAICPTGALRLEDADQSRALEFDAAECIACGECQRVCPSKALSLWPAGKGMVPEAAVTLIERRTVACTSCDERFVAIGDEQCCSLCQKSMNVMAEVASLRFRPTVRIEDGTIQNLDPSTAHGDQNERD